MTVQGPVKKQQPDGMSHGGGGSIFRIGAGFGPHFSVSMRNTPPCGLMNPRQRSPDSCYSVFLSACASNAHNHPPFAIGGGGGGRRALWGGGGSRGGAGDALRNTPVLFYLCSSHPPNTWSEVQFFGNPDIRRHYCWWLCCGVCFGGVPGSLSFQCTQDLGGAPSAFTTSFRADLQKVPSALVPALGPDGARRLWPMGWGLGSGAPSDGRGRSGAPDPP